MQTQNDTKLSDFVIRKSTKDDVSIILRFIKELAEYEKLAHLVVADEAILLDSLFGDQPKAEAVIGFYRENPVGVAVFFQNYSTFLGRAGIFLEDLYVRPDMRGRGFGKALLKYVARVARERKCSRYEWAVLDWNKPAIDFYKSLGAVAQDEWTVYRVSGEALDKLAE
jgi:GNAT superfamily N-acetyltransferase